MFVLLILVLPVRRIKYLFILEVLFCRVEKKGPPECLKNGCLEAVKTLIVVAGDAGQEMFSVPLNIFANPRKLINPAISVTVVKTIDEDWAGSKPKDFNITGMTAPEKAAMTMDKTIAMPMTIESP